MDPGSTGPARHDFDVRDVAKTSALMELENLGPNGAAVRALELATPAFLRWFRDWAEEMGDQPSVVLVDTPGQLEVYLTSEVGAATLSSLADSTVIVGVFLFDGLRSSAHDVAVDLFLYGAASLKLGVPLLPVVHKADAENSTTVLTWLSDAGALAAALAAEAQGVLTDFTLATLEVVQGWRLPARPLLTSALPGFEDGLAGLWEAVGETRCSCGDLT